MEAQKKKVSIRLNSLGPYINLSIHNWGNPISLEDQNLLFKKHYRGESAVNLMQNGWGIGLTLVKGLCETMNGSVSLSSSENTGTTFTVELPVKNHISSEEKIL